VDECVDDVCGCVRDANASKRDPYMVTRDKQQAIREKALLQQQKGDARAAGCAHTLKDGGNDGSDEVHPSCFVRVLSSPCLPWSDYSSGFDAG
jgi:hypothetical protein